MAGSLETAKDYLVSVSKRTIGMERYQRVRRYLRESFGDAAAKDIGVVLPVGIIAGTASQVVMPAINELLPRLVAEHPDHITTLARYILPPTFIDVATWYLPALLSHNPAEFVVLKLAANAATHVALDLGSAAINRLKTFRPSATTLAV